MDQDFTLASCITQRLGCMGLKGMRTCSLGRDVKESPTHEEKRQHTSTNDVKEDLEHVKPNNDITGEPCNNHWYYSFFPRRYTNSIRRIRVTQKTTDDIDKEITYSHSKSMPGLFPQSDLMRRSELFGSILESSLTRAYKRRSSVISDPNPEEGCYLDLINRRVTVMSTRYSAIPDRVKGVLAIREDFVSKEAYYDCLLEMEVANLAQGKPGLDENRIKYLLAEGDTDSVERRHYEMKRRRIQINCEPRLVANHFTFEKLRSL